VTQSLQEANLTEQSTYKKRTATQTFQCCSQHWHLLYVSAHTCTCT